MARVRRVRTLEGSRRYGLPIGAPIRPDAPGGGLLGAAVSRLEVPEGAGTPAQVEQAPEALQLHERLRVTVGPEGRPLAAGDLPGRLGGAMGALAAFLDDHPDLKVDLRLPGNIDAPDQRADALGALIAELRPDGALEDAMDRELADWQRREKDPPSPDGGRLAALVTLALAGTASDLAELAAPVGNDRDRVPVRTRLGALADHLADERYATAVAEGRPGVVSALWAMTSLGADIETKQLVAKAGPAGIGPVAEVVRRARVPLGRTVAQNMARAAADHPDRAAALGEAAAAMAVRPDVFGQGAPGSHVLADLVIDDVLNGGDGSWLTARPDALAAVPAALRESLGHISSQMPASSRRDEWRPVAARGLRRLMAADPDDLEALAGWRENSSRARAIASGVEVGILARWIRRDDLEPRMPIEVDLPLIGAALEQVGDQRRIDALERLVRITGRTVPAVAVTTWPPEALDAFAAYEGPGEALVAGWGPALRREHLDLVPRALEVADRLPAVVAADPESTRRWLDAPGTWSDAERSWWARAPAEVREAYQRHRAAGLDHARAVRASLGLPPEGLGSPGRGARTGAAVGAARLGEELRRADERMGADGAKAAVAEAMGADLDPAGAFALATVAHAKVGPGATAATWVRMVAGLGMADGDEVRAWVEGDRADQVAWSTAGPGGRVTWRGPWGVSVAPRVDDPGRRDEHLEVGRHAGAAAASYLVRAWAETANDDAASSLWLQDRARDLFGLPGTLDWDHSPEALAEKAAISAVGPDADVDVVMAAMYERTQALLRERGIASVRAWRGWSWVDDEHVPAWAKAGGEAVVPHRPMSSYSLSREVAERFAAEAGRGDSLTRWDVPAERIVACPLTGWGCLREQELVVLGSEVPGIRVEPLEGRR
jgi:hypothetical protein